MSAQLLPNGRQQFVDQNGNPLVSGLVYFYVPNTTTPKNTWQDAGETILNPNPIILDARGQATIFGSGDYRQVLTDAAGNTIWDKNLSSPVVPASETEAGILELASNADVEAGTDTTKAVTPAGVWDWYTNAKVFKRDATTGTARKLSEVLYNNLPVNIEDFGGSTDSTDNTAALNAAVDYCVANGLRRIYFPGEGANYYFTSAPDAFTVGITLCGDNPRTWLVRNYTPADDFTPFLEWTGLDGTGSDGDKGGGLVNIGLYADDGTTKGTAIAIVATDTIQRPGYMRFENVVISGGGTWGFGVRVDGSSVAVSGSQGMRDVTFDSLYVFECTNTPMQVSNGVHIFGNSIALFGSPALTSLAITGAGTTLTNSNDVVFQGLDVGGNITVQNAANVYLSGDVRGDVTVLSTALNCVFSGIVTGTYATSAPATDVNSATSSSGDVILPNGLRLQWKTATLTTSTTAQTVTFPSSFANATLGAWLTFTSSYIGGYSLTTDLGDWFITLGSTHAATTVTLFALGK